MEGESGEQVGGNQCNLYYFFGRNGHIGGVLEYSRWRGRMTEYKRGEKERNGLVVCWLGVGALRRRSATTNTQDDDDDDGAEEDHAADGRHEDPHHVHRHAVIVPSTCTGMTTSSQLQRISSSSFIMPPPLIGGALSDAFV